MSDTNKDKKPLVSKPDEKVETKPSKPIYRDYWKKAPKG